MLVLILIVAWVAVFVTTAIRDDRRARRAPPHERAEAVHSTAPVSSFVGWLRSYGRPLIGDAGDTTSLIAAGRLSEAFDAVRPDDREGRARLAIAAAGSAPELILAAAKPTPLRLRRRARVILVAQHPDLGFTLPRFVVRSVEPTTAHLARVQRHLRRGHLRRAARSFERAARRRPRADDAARWVYTAAAARILLGHLDHAKGLLAPLANEGTDPGMRARASLLSRRLSQAMRSSEQPGPVGPGSPHAAIRPLERAAARRGGVWPWYPGELAELLKRPRMTTEIAVWDRQVAQAALQVNQEVYVGLITLDDRVTVLPVASLDPLSGLVHLGDGTCWLWEELRERSHWGDRMVIARHTSQQSIATAHPAPEATHGPVREPDGAERAHAADIERVRRLTEDHPDDELVWFTYMRLLARAAGTGAGQDPAVFEHAIAMCAVRFPGSVWRGLGLNAFVDGSVEGSVAWLHAARELPDAPYTDEVRSELLPDPYDGALRRAFSRTRVLRTDQIFRGAERAAVRGSGAGVDAYLRLLPDVAEFAHLRLRLTELREVAYRGPEAALDHLPPADQERGDVSTAAALAAHSGSPTAIARVRGQLEAGRPFDVANRELAVVSALHAGDAAQVVELATASQRVSGPSPLMSAAVRDALVYLATPAQARDLLADIVPMAADLPAAGGDLVAALDTTWLAADALEVSRAAARASTASPETRAGHLTALLTAIEQVPAAPGGGEPVAADVLASWVAEARDILDGLEGVAGFSTVMPALRVAVTRFEDLDRAWELVSQLDPRHPTLLCFCLAADVALRRGDATAAAQLRARAANPLVIREGLSLARRSGVRGELRRVLAAAERQSIGVELRAFHASAAPRAAAPPVPTLDDVPTPDLTLDRLAREGDWDALSGCVAHRRTPLALLQFGDGARDAAWGALGAAVAGSPADLRRRVDASRHPLYTAAASIASAHGIDVGLTPGDIAARAGGITLAAPVEVER